MAETTGRGQSRFAFRAGFNPQPLLALERNKRRLAQDQAYQEKLLAEKRQKTAVKFEQDAKIDTSGLPPDQTKIIQNDALSLVNDQVMAYKQFDGLVPEQAMFDFSNRRREIQNKRELLMSQNNELNSLNKKFNAEKKFYNIPLLSEKFYEYKNNMLSSEDGSLNPDFNVSNIYEELNSAKYLNTPAVANNFVDEVQERIEESINGNAETTLSYKLAQPNAKGTGYIMDDNGNYVLQNTPELVRLAKSDPKMKILLDDYIAKEQEIGNSNVTYKDALQNLIQPFIQADKKVAVKNSSESSKDYSSVRWKDIDNVQYKTEIDSDLLGTTSSEASLTPLGIKNEKIVYDDGQDQVAYQGDVTRAIIDSDGNPQIEMAVYEGGGSTGVVTVPFTESVLRQMQGKTDRKGGESLQKLYNSINNTTKKLYINPSKKTEAKELIKQTLQKNERNILGGDKRSSEKIKEQVVNILSELGVQVNPDLIDADASNFRVTSNAVKYKGKTYYAEEEGLAGMESLINQIIADNPKAFELNEEAYTQKYNQNLIQKTSQIPSSLAGGKDDLPDL